MKDKSIYTRKLVSSVFITILLIYFMIKKTSPKIIFVPFLAGIYFVKKRLVKPKEKTNNEKSEIKTKLNIDIKVLISVSLVIIVLLSVIAMLFFGIIDTYRLNSMTKGYIVTDGYYSDCDIFTTDKDGTTYKLTYIYMVDGKEYSVTTDYGTNYIPDKNSSRETKYNPNNPDEAIITGTNSKNGLIFFGAFFTS